VWEIARNEGRARIRLIKTPVQSSVEFKSWEDFKVLWDYHLYHGY